MSKDLSTNILSSIDKQNFDYFKPVLNEYAFGKKKCGKLRASHPQEYINILYITDFLSSTVTMRQRFWHIENKLLNIPICDTCNTNEKRWLEGINNYKEYCEECYIKLGIHGKRIDVAKIKKYGKSNIELCKERMLATHGVDNIFATKEFIDNRIKYNLEKYGVNHYVETEEFKEKHLNSLRKKYNVDHYSKTKEFKEKHKATCQKKYGVDHQMQTAQFQEKRKITSLKRYGVNHNMKIHLSLDTLEKIENEDWLKKEHDKKSVKQIANEINCSSTLILKRFKKFNIDIIHRYISNAQNEIQFFLKNFIQNIKQNERKIIYPYELDIYMPDKNIAIEYCGLYWHNEMGKADIYHRMKYNLCKQKGIRLITIFEDEWLKNKELVKEKLLHILKLSQKKKIYARKCEIKTLQQHEKKEFFNKTHIQGDGPSSLNYGLFYNNMLVAAISFIKQTNNEYILNRYSTNANVVGGFTKLLKHFEKTLNPKKITTFADLRWSQGNLYEKSGFSLDKELHPDYDYVMKNKRIYKFNFNSTHTKTKLKNYKPELTKHQNMLNNKIYRIYDVGKLRFIKTY